jgi:hypothetical protein
MTSMTSDTRPRRRPALLAILWGVGILLGTALPLGGLAVAVAAVLTSYRRASPAVKVVLVGIGLLTVLYQVGTLTVFGTSHGVGTPHRVS